MVCNHIVEPLPFPDDLRIAFEAPFPELVADHGHGVGVLPDVFARLESAAENRMYPNGVKIIRRYDAPCRDLGPVADAESRAIILLTKNASNSVQFLCKSAKSGHERAVWPDSPRGRSGEGKQLLLVGYRRVRTE